MNTLHAANNKFTLYTESCLDTMARMPEGLVDLTVTSPPYESLRTYDTPQPWDFTVFCKVARELHRVTKPGGVCVWVVGDQTHKGSESLMSFRQALKFRELGFLVHDTMIYRKVGCAFTPKNKYYQVFEYMFVLSKGSPKTFNPLQIPRTGHQYGSVGTSKRGNKRAVVYDPTHTTRNAENVWTIANHSKNATKDEEAYEHPAIFPEKLAEGHILSWSKPGDLVYDPFSGSGTTAKMALTHGRRFVGSETSDKYAAITLRRVKHLLKQT